MPRADVNLYQNVNGGAISFSAVADGSNILASQGAYEMKRIPLVLCNFLKKTNFEEIYLRSAPPSGSDFKKLDEVTLAQIDISIRNLGVESKVILC